MEGIKRRSQLYFGEYVWLGSDLKQNIRGRYIIILPVAVVMLTLRGLARNQKPS